MGSTRTVVALGVVAVAAVGAVLWLISRPAEVVVENRPVTETVATGTRGAAAPAKPAAKRDHAGRSGTGAVVGTVRVYGTDKPVGAAKVTLSCEDTTLEAVTQPDGSFAVPRVPKADAWTLHVAAAEGLGEAQLGGIVIAERRTTDVGIVYLAPGFAMPGIVEDEHGAPIPGASVVALKPRPEGKRLDVMALIRDLPTPTPAAQTTESGADGRFRLTGVPPGQYTIVARKSGFATAVDRDVLVAPSAQALPIHLVLGKGYRVEGRVVRKGEGAVASLPVVAFEMEGMPDMELPGKSIVTTDDKGAFVFDGLAAGNWSMCAACVGEAMGIGENVKVPHTGPVELTIGGASSLVGRVTGEADAPVVGAQVIIGGDKFAGTARTDADGRYALRGLPTESAQFLLIQADGYCPYPPGGVFAMMQGDQRLTLKDGENTRDVKLTPGGKIRGAVVEDGTKKPIPGATVSTFSAATLFGGAPVSMTGEDGKFEIVGVPVGECVLTVKKSGWCDAGAADMKTMMAGFNPFGNQQAAGDAKDTGEGANVVIAKQGDVVERTIGLVRAVVLTGRVVGPAGDPVAGARVTAESDDDSGGGMFGDMSELLGGGAEPRMSDEKGRFEIGSPVAKGKIHLAATATGRLPAKSEPIEIGGAAAPPETELKLGAGATIEGRVTDPAGAPVEGADVTWSGAGEGRRFRMSDTTGAKATSGADGTFRLAGVAPGDVSVHVKRPPFVAADHEGVKAEEGKAVHVDVQLEPGLSIVGKLTREDGKPVQNAWVQVTADKGDASEDGGDVEMVSEFADGGAFRVECLRAGNYKLVGHSDGATDSAPVVVAAGAADVVIRLSVQLTISGVVRFKDGRPAVGVHVSAQPRTKSDTPQAMTFNSNSGLTGADGSFRVEGVAAGANDLTVTTRSPWSRGGSSINMRSARLPNVVAGAIGVVIEVEPGLTISGSVVGPDGAPVAAGEVSCGRVTSITTPAAGGETKETVFDEDVEGVHSASIQGGKFEASGLVPGKYTVTVSGQGFASQSQPMVDAGTKDLVFHVTKGGTIKGRVVGLDGKAATPDQTYVSVEGDGNLFEQIGADGAFTIVGVSPGVHTVSAQSFGRKDGGLKGEAKDVHVADGQTVEGVEIHLKKSE